MPVHVDKRKEWIERRLVDEFDRPIKVRQWMEDHILKPLDGFKSWHRGERLCDDCRNMDGEIFPSRAECERAPHDECDGLEGHKIITVLVNLKRQQGKTTTGAAYSLSELFLAKNSNVLYIGSAEDQAKGVYSAKWKTPIAKNPHLKRRATVRGKRIDNAKKGSYFQFIATSLLSAPGGSWRLIIIDEATLVPDEIMAKLVPAVVSAHGRECPEAHYTGGADEKDPTECPTCGAPLAEFFGRILVMSSSDDPQGAFFEMIEAQLESPDPSVHMFRSDETLNPHTSVEAMSSIHRSWGRVPSMKGILDRQFGVEFARAGDEFMPEAAITAITNKDLQNVDESPLPCVGFLDCSRSGDLTSLVLCADPLGARGGFKKIATARIDTWDPKNKAQCPKGRVDYAEIRRHLEELMPRFPGLIELQIDVSVAVSEATDLFEWARTRPWGMKVQAYSGNELESILMWDQLEIRAMAGRAAIEIQNHAKLKDELRRATIKVTERGVRKVVDTNKGNRRGGRRRHRDVAMSLAGCCLIASRYGVGKGKAGRGVASRLNDSSSLNSRFRPIGAGITTEKF